MSYTSLIRISFNDAPNKFYQDTVKILAGTRTSRGVFDKIGTHLFSVTGGNESDVLEATEKLIQKLKTKPKVLDYINITIAKDD